MPAKTERLVTSEEIRAWVAHERRLELIRCAVNSAIGPLPLGPVERMAAEINRLWAKDAADAAK